MSVPIQEVKLPEATHPDEIAVHLQALLMHDIPGFIIRHEGSGAVDESSAEKAHVHNVERAKDALQVLHPDKTIDPVHIDDFTGKGQDEVGEFHRDEKSVYSDMITADHLMDSREVPHTEPFIHTTLTGGGQILVAKPGSNPDINRYDRDSNKLANDLLVENKVDPELTDPKVYHGEVKTGDSVVIAGSGRRAAWHRFDTDPKLGTRKVTVTNFIDNTHPKVEYRRFSKEYDAWEKRRENGDFGFDLKK